MNRGRAQSEVILTVMLAGLMVLSVPAAVAPSLGNDPVTEWPAASAPIETPTVTPSVLNEENNITTKSTNLATPTTPLSTSGKVQNKINSTFGASRIHRNTLHGTRMLVTETASDGQQDNLTRAVRQATVGTKLQVRILNRSNQPRNPTDVTLQSTPIPDHDSPSAAVIAVLDRYDVTPTAQQAENIHALDDLPDPTRSELTDVLDAYLGYYMASQQAYADVNWTRLQTLANDSDSELPTFRNKPASGAGNRTITKSTFPDAAKVDVPRVRAAQVRFLETTVDLNTALKQANSPILTTPSSHPTNPFGVKEGPIAINLSTHNNTYADDYALLIDRGGDDTYHNNAGGGNLNYRVAALIDLAGNDNYTSGDSAGVNGGGSGGAGFLLDVGGDDTYTAGDKGTNGGARFGGVGFLLDVDGDDAYTAGEFGTNGGGLPGGIGLPNRHTLQRYLYRNRYRHERRRQPGYRIVA